MAGNSNSGRSTRFKKGMVPWSKGRIGCLKPNKTSFKEGLIPWNKGKKYPAVTGEKHGKWKGGKPCCLNCKVKLSSYGPLRCRKCSAVQRVGTKNWRWISDRTKLKKQNRRGDSLYCEWRKQVWRRDNFKCKIANANCNGRIEAHHILGWSEYPELRYQINNGITLCHAHHPRKRAEEKRMQVAFQQLVSSVSKV